jgi:hypothetical protein
MGNQIQVFSESIDDVLTAVQETPRGRWFIEAFTARLKAADTANILTAIAKLEQNLERLSNTGAANEVLAKARSAIATARGEIAKLEPQAAELSSEAKLFSNLAELSRKAFKNTAENPTLGKGVERALKLVADLDHELNSKNPEFATPPKPAAHYFKQDEAVFEPAPAKPKPVAVKTLELPELANKGAKLTIRKVNAELAQEPLYPAPVETTEPIIALVPPAPETPAELSRIVIIRRKADEVLEVPLVDLAAETVNAA